MRTIDATVQFMTVDRSGDLVVMGRFEGTVDFGGITMTATGLRWDHFLAKYSASDGTLLSAHQFAYEVISYPAEIDPAGDILTTDTLERTTGDGHHYYSILAAKVSSSDGSYLWSREIGGPGEALHPDLAVDENGDLILTGRCMGTVDLGEGPVVECGGVFLAKYAGADGAHLWSHDWRDASPGAVTVNTNGDIVLTGGFAEAVDLGAGEIVGQDGGNAFVARYRGSDGGHKWSRSGGATWDVTTDLADDIVVVGGLRGTEPWLVAKYSASGEHLWSAERQDLDIAESVATDAEGNIALLGARTQVTPDPSYDFVASFFMKYSPAGEPVWRRDFLASDELRVNALAVDSGGNVAIAGWFSGTVEFPGGELGSTSSSGSFVISFPP